MNNYCINQCPIGQKYKATFLEQDDSVFDAVSDVQRMLEACMKTCQVFREGEESLENGDE